jgi:hypothetical protein
MQRSRDCKKKSFKLLSRSPPQAPTGSLSVFLHKLTVILRAEDKFFPSHTTRQTGRDRPAICNLEHLIIADACAKDTPRTQTTCRHRAQRPPVIVSNTQYYATDVDDGAQPVRKYPTATGKGTCLITPILTALLTVPNPVPVLSLHEYSQRC